MKNASTISLAGGIILGAMGVNLALAETPEQRDGCMHDAFRFCSSAIPDHNQVFNCLVANRAVISPACRALITPSTVSQSKRAS